MNKSVLSLMLSSLLMTSGTLPAWAQLEVTVSGNGADSTNTVNDTSTNTSEVFQTNTASVQNRIVISSNTGGNSANNNTGGNAQVQTGSTSVTATITNDVNSNEAYVTPCDCEMAKQVTIEENGTGSDNTVNLNETTTTSVVQNNTAAIDNKLTINANTGENEINGLTGGSAEVMTGNVTVNPVNITNLVNSNIAVVGRLADPAASPAPAMTLTVGGNGSDSANIINMGNDYIVDFFQNNNTTVLNDLVINGNSGGNQVNNNTMPDDPLAGVEVETGNVIIQAAIDTASGFNVASDDCGCIQDITSQVLGNGTEAVSDITLDLVNDSLASQDNVDNFATAGELNCGSGENDANGNTNGSTDTLTGNCTSNFTEDNSGGSNFFGPLSQLPGAASFNYDAFLQALGVEISY